MEMTTQEKKTLAQSLFLGGQYTQKAIAEMVRVTEQTISRWAKEGDWDNLKQIRSVTRPELLRDSYAQLKAINAAIEEQGGVPTQDQYNAKSVIGKEIERLQDNPIRVYAECFTDFSEWLMRNEPSQGSTYSGLMLRFLEYKMR